MRNEHSIKYTPGLPPCPSCSQIMRLAGTASRFGDLPDIHTFECRACGVSYIEEAPDGGITAEVLCSPSLYSTGLSPFRH
jgi:hypothetical protein